MLKLRQYQTVLVTCWRCFLYEVKFALYLQTHNVSYFLGIDCIGIGLDDVDEEETVESGDKSEPHLLL